VFQVGKKGQEKTGDEGQGRRGEGDSAPGLRACDGDKKDELQRGIYPYSKLFANIEGIALDMDLPTKQNEGLEWHDEDEDRGRQNA